MISHGLEPAAHVFPSVLRLVLDYVPAVKAGQQVHGIASISGFDSDSFVQSSLFHMLEMPTSCLVKLLNGMWFYGVLSFLVNLDVDV
jgi:hypothetical protein